MSVYSMTGYASLQTLASQEDISPAQPRLGLEIRSVNSRFLDLGFKLGDELRGYESSLRELLTQNLKRGKVELRAFVVPSHTSGLVQASPPVALLQQLSHVQEQVLSWLPQAQPLSVADVLRIGSGRTDTGTGNADLAAPLMAMAQEALKAFIASREREGARLASMLGGHAQQLRALVKTAQPLVPKLVAAQQQRFLDRFTEALSQANHPTGVGGHVSASAAQERALTEAAAFAIRIDVAEELTRLVAHLDEIESLLAQAGKPGKAASPVKAAELGKRLDFTIQELHREANTLGSKSSTLELSRISVDMKVLIEQMREQVQNIE